MIGKQRSGPVCLACESLKEEILRLAPENLILKFYPIGLHESPALLNRALQRDILQKGNGVDIILAYGFCSGSTVGLYNPGGRLVLPGSHDCIRLLRGPGQEQARSYFLSPSWVRYGRTPLQEREQLINKYGKEAGVWVFANMFRHYRQITFINTMDSWEGIEETLIAARETARQLGWAFMVEQGSTRRLERLLKGCWDFPDFLVLSPGERVEEGMFFRCNSFNPAR
ncbi:MAG: hypothetical protein BWY80_00061 [Firmicutes bacterium ADurb.Bin456]|nr:MAG: hypothetical protein BWY80_00061 [Firmicutes bacterium ADurb.Bin456]